MKIKMHVLRDVTEPVDKRVASLGYRTFVANPDWKRNLISITSVLWHPQRERLICGLTSFDTDIMYEFDPKTSAFRGLNYPSVSEPFEIKIHRSLHLLPDGKILGATACLHREDQRLEAPGGKLFILDPETLKYDILGIPVPHDYIQTITVDDARGLVYGFTYPVFNFFVYDLKKRKVRRTDYMGSIPHIVALADDGGYWATWNNSKHNLFRYDPDSDTIRYYDHSLPCTAKSCGIMYAGAGPIDSMANGKDGYLYIGEANGNLDRLDPKTGEVVDLGKPVGDLRRMAALEVGPDGRLYGISGFINQCHLFAYDLKTNKFEDFGVIADPVSGKEIFIGHDIAFASKNKVFIGETDTQDRASYLWECDL
ncbi:MAG: hypothetical protein ABIH86_05500 [Planctomycetota bacterium]